MRAPDLTEETLKHNIKKVNIVNETMLTSLFPIGTYVTMARTPYFPNRHISDDG